ncbi:unnamed protein product, partial [Brenthis ino]
MRGQWRLMIVVPLALRSLGASGERNEKDGTCRRQIQRGRALFDLAAARAYGVFRRVCVYADEMRLRI